MNLTRTIEKWLRLRVLRILTGSDPRGRIPAIDDDAEISRILLIRVDRIGDAVLSTPVIRTLRSIYPEATIDILLGEKNRAIGRLLPEIENLLVWERRPDRLLRTIVRLRRAPYDLVINLHLDRSSNAELTSRIARGRYLLEGWRTGWPEGVHAADATFQVIRPLLDSIDHPETLRHPGRLFLRQGDEVESGDGIGINLSVRDAERRWDEKSVRELVVRLCDRFGKILLIAHPDDSDLLDRLVEQVGCGYVESVTPADLPSLLRAYERCSILVTPDSGGLHLGVACGRPIVGLFSTREKMRRWGPWGVPNRVIFGDGRIDSISSDIVFNEICDLMSELTTLKTTGEGIR